MEAEPGQQSASSGSSQEDLETEDESSEHLHVNIEKPETSRHSSLSGSRSPNISQGWEARNTPPLQGEPKESAPAPAALDDRRLGIGSPEALQALCDAAEVASGTSQPQGNSSAGNSSPGHSQGGSGGGRSLKRPVRPIGAEHSKRSKLGPGPRDPAVDGLEAGPPGDSAGAPPSGFRHYPPGQRAVEPQSGESVAVGQRGFSEPSQASGGSAGPPLPSHADPRGQPMPMRTSRSSQELASDPEHEPWTGRRPPSGGGGGDAAAAAAEHRTAAPSQQSTRGGEHPLEAGARLDAQRTSQRPPPPERPQRAESPGIEPPAQRTDPRSQAQRPGPSAERPVYRPPPRAEYRLDPRDPQLEQALEGRPLPPSGRRPPSRPHPSGPGGSGQQQLHSRRPPAHPRDPRNSQQGDGLPPGYGGMRPFSGGQREGYSGGQGYAPPMRRHPPQGLPPQGLPQQGLPPNRPLPGGDGAGQAGSWGNRGPSRNVPVMNDYLIPSSRRKGGIPCTIVQLQLYKQVAQARDQAFKEATLADMAVEAIAKVLATKQEEALQAHDVANKRTEWLNRYEELLEGINHANSSKFG